MPTISGKQSASLFGNHFGQFTAIGEGSVYYWANNARNDITMTLTWSGRQVPVPAATYQESSFLPRWSLLSNNPTFGLDATCDYTLRTSTVHSAWHQIPVPGPWAGEFGKQIASSSSPAVQSEACEKTGYEPRQGGGGNPDQWFLCYYEEWTNAYGQRVRDYLWCTPL